MTWRDATTRFAMMGMLAAVGGSGRLSVGGLDPAPARQRVDTIVKQAGRPLHANGGTLVPELSIGVVDGAQEYMFGNVVDILETRDGSILVVDGQAFAIRQYDAKGAYIRTLGRKGQGPGEYTRPGKLAELPDGRILLVDGGNRRVNVYSRAGEPVDSWQLAVGSVRVSSNRITVDTTGTVVAAGLASGGGGSLFLRFAPDGHVVDTIHVATFAYTRPTADAAAGGMRGSAMIPFNPEPRSVWSPLGYMVTGLPVRYAFEIRMPRPGRPAPSAAIPAMRYGGPTPRWTPGDPIISVRHSVPTVIVSEEQRSAERAGVEAILRQIDPAARFSGPDIPRVKPPYKDLRVGEDGTIWIQLSTPGERYMPDPPATPAPGSGPVLPRWREPAVYDVFEPDGRYLGRVSMPSSVTIQRLSRDRVWGTAADEDDVAVVKRFRIDWR